MGVMDVMGIAQASRIRGHSHLSLERPRRAVSRRCALLNDLPGHRSPRAHMRHCTHGGFVAVVLRYTNEGFSPSPEGECQPRLCSTPQRATEECRDASVGNALIDAAVDVSSTASAAHTSTQGDPAGLAPLHVEALYGIRDRMRDRRFADRGYHTERQPCRRRDDSRPQSASGLVHSRHARGWSADRDRLARWGLREVNPAAPEGIYMAPAAGNVEELDGPDVLRDRGVNQQVIAGRLKPKP